MYAPGYLVFTVHIWALPSIVAPSIGHEVFVYSVRSMLSPRLNRSVLARLCCEENIVHTCPNQMPAKARHIQ